MKACLKAYFLNIAGKAIYAFGFSFVGGIRNFIYGGN